MNVFELWMLNAESFWALTQALGLLRGGNLAVGNLQQLCENLKQEINVVLRLIKTPRIMSFFSPALINKGP